MKSPEHSITSRTCRNKGGIILTAIIFSVISAVVVGSFLRLTSHEMRLSNIQFYSNESLNLAESGLEEGLYALNFTNWDGWETDGSSATLSVTGIPIGAGATGDYHVLVEDRFDDPTVTAEGKVSAGSGLDSTKQVQISLRRRSYFVNGITSRESVTFSGGNAHVDSYRSSEGPFSSDRRRDRGAVASISVETDAIELGNGHVWGYVFTGGSEPDVRNGTILGEDSPDGITIDRERIAYDFSAEFPVPRDPPPYSLLIPAITENTTLGVPGSETALVVRTNNVNLNNRELTIDGPVILIVDNDVNMSGNSGGLTVTETGSLRIYIGEDFSVTGKGMGNLTRLPDRLIVFGTNETHQTFSLGGNARWEAGIYAPNADLELNGGGNEGHMSGAVVGKNVTIVGGSKFHYDEDLTHFSDGFGFAMDTWQELLGSNRIEFN